MALLASACSQCSPSDADFLLDGPGDDYFLVCMKTTVIVLGRRSKAMQSRQCAQRVMCALEGLYGLLGMSILTMGCAERSMLPMLGSRVLTWIYPALAEKERPRGTAGLFRPPIVSSSLVRSDRHDPFEYSSHVRCRFSGLSSQSLRALVAVFPIYDKYSAGRA